MKNIMKLGCALLLAMLMVAATALADDASVIYRGRSSAFDFAPGSEYSDTDLFANFKNVMPGDTLTQTITVENRSSKKVRIYLQAKEGVSEEDAELLSQLHLTVRSQNGTIFDAAADEKGGLARPRLLGTFKTKGKTQLTVTLEVPIELDNAYMNRIGTIPWTFMMAEMPDDDSPHTGDWFQPALWLGAAAMLICAVMIVLVLQRKKERDE